MNRALLFLAASLLFFISPAHAYEYKLQFSQGGAYGLTVAGYSFYGNTVFGNCSYYTVSAGSGRGGHGSITHHYNTCTWDLYGNLISVTPVSANPVAPPPLSTSGTETIYAVTGSSSTGHDSRGFGFVNTPSAHYTWQTANDGYADIPYTPYTIVATLISDGDFPLIFDSATVTTTFSSYYTATAGTATVSGTTCSSSVPVGTTCSVTISYNPTTIACTGSPYGFAYTGIDLALVTDAGTTTNFTERFTVMGIPLCDD